MGSTAQDYGGCRIADLNPPTEPTIADYFDGCLYFTLGKLQRRINRMAEEAFSPLGLSPSHAYLLKAVEEGGPLTSGDLAAILGLAPSTITRFVDRLEKDGYCCRKSEGRLAMVDITDKGRTLIPAFAEAWKRLFEAYNDALGAEEADRLNRMVVALNLSEPED